MYFTTPSITQHSVFHVVYKSTATPVNKVNASKIRVGVQNRNLQILNAETNDLITVYDLNG